MKTKRLLPLILAAATAVGVLAGCKTGGTPAQTSGTTGGTEEKPMPKLTSLSVDGENIAFDPDTNAYTVKIPDGHPVIPEVKAEAGDGAAVKVIKGTIPAGEKEGKAEVTVSSQGVDNRYTVTFVKDAEKGFVLQYADVYCNCQHASGKRIVC